VGVSDSVRLRLIAESGGLKLFPVPPVSKSFKPSKSDYCANVARELLLYVFRLPFHELLYDLPRSRECRIYTGDVHARSSYARANLEKWIVFK